VYTLDRKCVEVFELTFRTNDRKSVKCGQCTLWRE
jgi:hypothetical protein